MAKFQIVAQLADEDIKREYNFHKEVVAKNFWRGVQTRLMPDSRRDVVSAMFFKTEPGKTLLIDRLA